MVYGYFGVEMMNGSYGWMFFNWIIGLLIIMGLILFIIWIIKKIQEDTKKQKGGKKL